MKNKPLFALFAALLLTAPFFWTSLHGRWLREQNNKDVEICVDGPQWEAMTAARADRSVALSRLKELGVSSIGVYWNGVDPLETAAAAWEDYVRAGLRLTLRPDPAPFAPVRLSALADFPGAPNVSHLLFAGPAVWGAPGISETLRQMEVLPWPVPWVEFGRQAGLNSIVRRFPERVVRAHSLDEDEMARLSPARLEARFRRAVRERGVRFLYARFFPGLDFERNMAHLRRLAEGLRADGFRPAASRPRFQSQGGRVRLRQLAALLAAALLPVLVFRTVSLGVRNVPGAVLGTQFFSLCSALAVAAVISIPAFELGLETFRGVKAALAVPLAAGFFLLYPPAEIRGALARPLTTGKALLFLAFAAAAAVYVLRSGHGTALDAGGAELRLREGLEHFFGVRPRFKEFAIGHPALWLGVYLCRRFPGAGEIHRPLLLVGLIGPVSIVNTFCHAHIPLALSLLRVWHGIWLGALIGGALILLTKAVVPAKTFREDA